MDSYIVLYRIESIMTPLDSPFSFRCIAYNVDDAEQQFLNAFPEGDIVWVSLGESVDNALDEYYSIPE